MLACWGMSSESSDPSTDRTFISQSWSCRRSPNLYPTQFLICSGRSKKTLSWSKHDTHWEAVSKIFTYLNGTISFVIWPDGKLNGLKLSHLTGKKLNSMNHQILRRRLRWRHQWQEINVRQHIFLSRWAYHLVSKKQRCIALSTTEAIIAACVAAKTAVWPRCILKDFTEENKQQVPIFFDNQGTI